MKKKPTAKNIHVPVHFLFWDVDKSGMFLNSPELFTNFRAGWSSGAPI
jgi:hypothetical protein